MVNKIRISILGCGWYGLPLARQLIALGYPVKGSTTSADKLTALSTEGIAAYLIKLSDDEPLEAFDFFDSEILIIAIPPRMRSGSGNNYLQKMELALGMIKNSAVKQVIYISSTSVFGDTNTSVDETAITQPETESGKAILSSEKLLQSSSGFTTTILRFAGLFGPERNPGRFFGGKTGIPNGKAPVNLIHLDDCIGITCSIIEKEAYGMVYHGVTPDHPSRQEFYTQASVAAGYAAPVFINELKEWKIVESIHVPLHLNYRFSHNTLLQPSQTNFMNPFFTTYTTPYHVPPFDKIKTEHFKPAILEGIEKEEAEINAIANNKAEPDFENTILAMENSGQLLTRVSSVFYNLNSANTNEEIQAIAREVAPAMAAHHDNIILNHALFLRVKQLWDNHKNLNLNAEQIKLLEKTHKAFVRSGANLNEADKTKLRTINSQLSLLGLNFGQNLLAETNAYQLLIDKKEDLSGLPEELVLAASESAIQAKMEGKWLFNLQNPSVMPFLQYADNRELRKQIWEAYTLRGDNNNAHDNKEIVRGIVNLRREKAQLLGYKDHASYVLEETMAKTPEAVYKLLNQLWQPALDVAEKEAFDLQKMIDISGAKFELAPYDWKYYTEKVRKERFDLDEQTLKPYFSLDNVREGVFAVATKLYGLQFKELSDIPKYHDDVSAYSVSEADGTFIGVLYTDFFPRASKRGGAWMTSYNAQKMENGKRISPVISIVCNFSKPAGDAPALLTFDEVTTFFHEFGHALHGLLSNVTYRSLAGTAVSRDFVELPSQIMENWATEPEVLRLFARHYETNEVIPDELIRKLHNAGTFDQGFSTTEYLAASFLDLDFHTQTEELAGSVDTFEVNSMKKAGLMKEIIPRYRSTYFNHIFAGGYSAGYYSYIWSGVLDTDAFAAFKETGDLFNQESAQSFRKNILEKGGTEEPMVLYKKFRGAEPGIKALLKKRGLDVQQEKKPI